MHGNHLPTFAAKMGLRRRRAFCAVTCVARRGALVLTPFSSPQRLDPSGVQEVNGAMWLGGFYRGPVVVSPKVVATNRPSETCKSERSHAPERISSLVGSVTGAVRDMLCRRVREIRTSTRVWFGQVSHTQPQLWLASCDAICGSFFSILISLHFFTSVIHSPPPGGHPNHHCL